MAVSYKIEVKKHRLGAEHKWSNDYYVDADTIIDAKLIGTGPILAFEKIVHTSNVIIDEILVSSFPVSGGHFVTESIADPGENGLASGQELPLWNTILMKLLSSTGRPALKYIRAPITEGNQDGGILDAGFVTSYQGYLADLFADVAELGTGQLCKSSGDQLTHGIVSNVVQMRQLHRKRRAAAP